MLEFVLKPRCRDFRDWHLWLLLLSELWAIIIGIVLIGFPLGESCELGNLCPEAHTKTGSEDGAGRVSSWPEALLWYLKAVVLLVWALFCWYGLALSLPSSALWSITTNKASGGDGILAGLLQILKDDAIKVLHLICLQVWKTQQWPQHWKRSVFFPIPKKGNAKECSNYCTIVLISHTSKVMLKILQAWMTQRDEMGREVGGGFRMGNTCKSMADSCQCMAKTTTIL